jgi:mannosyltransferase
MVGVAAPVRRRSAATVLKLGALPLVGLVLLAAALRFATIGVQSFSDDELFTVWLVRMPFGHMLTTIPHSEATPHLYYILAWVGARLFGTGEAAMRVLPAAAGTLTVLAIYRAGTVASRRVGLAAAAFAAVDPFLVWYSQEARAYSLVVLLCAVSLACFMSFVRFGGRRALAGWALASAAALATHYFALFLVVPEIAWLLATGRGDWRRRGAALAVPLLAGLALLPLALHQRSTVHDPGSVDTRALPVRLAAVPKNLLVGFSIPAEAFVIVAAAALAAVAVVLAWRRCRGRERRLFLLAAALAIATVLLPAALAVGGLDYVSSRNLIVALVPAAVALGCGFASGRAGAIALCALALLLAATVIGVAAGPQYQRRDWRGAARALGPASSDRVLVFSPGFSNAGPFNVYYRHSRLLTAAGVRVREVAVVALAGQKPFGPGAPAPPSGPAPHAPAGFREAEARTTSTFRLIRFTSNRPVVVTIPELQALAFAGTGDVLVWQTP